MTKDAIFATMLDMEPRQFSKEWFADRLARAGRTQASLFHFMEERFGLDRTKVNKMVNGKRRPQPEELPALLEWLGEPLQATIAGHRAAQDPPEVQMGEERNHPSMGPRDVPVRQLVTGGDDADFTFSDQVIDYVSRPPGLIGQRIIAAYVTGDSMRPKYVPGEPVYAYVARPALPGDYVIIELHPAAEGEPRRGFIKLLKRRTASKVICEQFNPPKDVEYDARQVVNVYRIAQPAELFG